MFKLKFDLTKRQKQELADYQTMLDHAFQLPELENMLKEHQQANAQLDNAIAATERLLSGLRK